MHPQANYMEFAETMTDNVLIVETDTYDYKNSQNYNWEMQDINQDTPSAYWDAYSAIVLTRHWMLSKN
jgi:hypothetical protein